MEELLITLDSSAPYRLDSLKKNWAVSYGVSRNCKEVLQDNTALTAHIFLLLTEETRREITQDACKCEAQILFQKKMQSTIQDLSRRHILSPLL